MDDMTDEQVASLLNQHTQRLDKIFQDFLVEPDRFCVDRYMNIALRAQAQCRTTARTLQQWQTLARNQQTGGNNPESSS